MSQVLQRNPSGWGYEGERAAEEELAQVRQLLAALFPDHDPRPQPEWRVEELDLRPSRVRVPAALSSICSDETGVRALHTYGRAYADNVRRSRGQFPNPPDVVAMPTTPAEVEAVLEWCAETGVSCVPFGGGTSVAGGVLPPEGPTVTLQTRRMAKLLDLDPMSRTAHLQAGATGPEVESVLHGHGYRTRFMPQSFLLSTLGGWMATRACGYRGVRRTRIDDIVEAVGAVTPVGRWDSRRLPASGTGPAHDRLLLGSEGTLAVFTDAWVRVEPLPRRRSIAVVHFATFEDGARCLRELAHAELEPWDCRLIDNVEALTSGVGTGERAALLLGFEGGDAAVSDAERAVAICRDAGGDCPDGAVHFDLEQRAPSPAEDPVEQWRQTFLRGPFIQDQLVRQSFIVETLETAATWDRFEEVRASVGDALREALQEICGGGIVTCRVSHTYSDGAAPYFTIVAPGRRGGEEQQWKEVKAAASEAIHRSGGTITHHHAVGRDHRAVYDREVPEPFRLAFAAAKQALDPTGTLNPGILTG